MMYSAYVLNKQSDNIYSLETGVETVSPALAGILNHFATREAPLILIQCLVAS